MPGRLALLIALVGLFLAGCNEGAHTTPGARILTMGDSLLAWHRTAEKSVSHRVEGALGEPVVDRSVIGARVIYELPVSGAMGLNIAKQFQPGDWDWIVLNGGGNDLWLGCGCGRCAGKMERMIRRDGRAGEIPRMVGSLRATGAQVIYVGYLRSPGIGSIIEHCRDDGDELERRIARMAAADPGVHFVSLADMVPHGDRSYHSADMIHPSMKASAVIGQRIAAIIRRGDARH